MQMAHKYAVKISNDFRLTIPEAMHFWNLQYLQLAFRPFSIAQFSLKLHLYVELLKTVLLKKLLHPSQLRVP